MKFFEIVPSGTRFPFVAKRKTFLVISAAIIFLSIASLIFNAATRGSALNFGIDFQGGSQVRLALSKDIDIATLRDSLDKLDYEGASIVEVPDSDNQVMIRVRNVVSISEEQIGKCQEAIGGLKDVKLAENGFDHPPGTSKIFLKFDKLPEYSEIDKLMNGAGCVGASEDGTGSQGVFAVDYTLVGVGKKLSEELDAEFGDGTVAEIVSSESVGAKVGEQLKTDGVWSLVYAVGGIFLFVMLRFDLRFAPGGIVALLHDSIIVLGAFSLTWTEFTLQTVAALLTIIGYSINDTIVVFDRVRERVALQRDSPIEETTNSALNDTLSRTILTSGTTLLVVTSIWVFGSGTIKDFAFALFIGVVVGTYSSLFVASPIFLWVNERFYRGQGHLMNAEEEGQGTGTLLGGAGDEAGEGDDSSPVSDDIPSAPETTVSGEKKASRRRRRPSS